MLNHGLASQDRATLNGTMNHDLFYVGIAHNHAPLSVRERLHPFADAQDAILAQVMTLAPERMVLSTCERFEVYSFTNRLHVEAWIDRLAAWFSVPGDVLARYTRSLQGDAVARHLMRVSSGFESRLFGEAQIQGQVKAAYLRALETTSLGPILSCLGRAALHAGKRVRNETGIGSGVRSLGTIAVRFIEKTLADFSRANVLIVGTGQLAAEVAASCLFRNLRNVTIAGRDVARTRGLADRFEARAASLNDIQDLVAGADVVITCTSSPSFLVDVGIMSAVARRSRLMLDLSVPRNVEPAVGGMEGLRLVHLDELLIGEGGRRESISAAEAVVDEELGRFSRWRREREVVPAIAALFRREAVGVGSASEGRVERHRRILQLKSSVAA